MSFRTVLLCPFCNEISNHMLYQEQQLVQCSYDPNTGTYEDEEIIDTSNGAFMCPVCGEYVGENHCIEIDEKRNIVVIPRYSSWEVDKVREILKGWNFIGEGEDLKEIEVEDFWVEV